MATDNDFFEQFRAQSEHLAETPEAKTWEQVASRLKKPALNKPENQFLGWSFIHVSLLASIIIITISILAWLNYHQALQAERHFLFFSNLQKCEGVWSNKKNNSREEIQITNVSPEKISFSKKIIFKKDTLQQKYFFVERKEKKLILNFDKNIFFEKKLEKNTLYFQSGNQEIKIANDTTNKKIIFTYDSRTEIVYSR